MYLGVNTHFAEGENPSLLDTAAADGVTNIRDEQIWSAVEQSPGVYSFPSSFTTYMAKASQDGISPLVIIDGTNSLYDQGYNPYTEQGRQAFAQYCVDVLKQYGGEVKQVEIWNEPNGVFDTGPAASDSALYYTEMLKDAYTAIKAAFPEVTVIGGAAAGIPTTWFQSLFQDGALNYMDALSIHPYVANPDGLDTTIDQLHTLMQSFGADKPIYATEFGNGSADPGYLVEAATEMSAAHVAGAYWYPLQDDRLTPSMGLLDANGNTKPAMHAYQLMQSILSTHPDAVRVDLGDSHVFDYKFGSDVQVVWGENEPISISGPHTTLDATGAVIADPATDSQPIIIEGAGATVHVTAAVLTDSQLDFGTPGWSYLAETGSGTTEALQPMSNAQAGNFLGDPNYFGLVVRADGMNPAQNGNDPVSAVERYTVAHDGTISVDATWTPAQTGGDGVDASISVDGKQVWHAVADGSPQQVSDLQLQVHAGDTIDFATGPHQSMDNDWTDFRATITSLDGVASGGSSPATTASAPPAAADAAPSTTDAPPATETSAPSAPAATAPPSSPATTVPATTPASTSPDQAPAVPAADTSSKAPASSPAAPHTLDDLSDGFGHHVYLVHTMADAGATIANFDPHADILDLTPLMNSLGINDVNALTDGAIRLVKSGAHSTEVVVDPDGNPAHAETVVTLQNVLPSTVAHHADIWH